MRRECAVPCMATTAHFVLHRGVWLDVFHASVDLCPYSPHCAVGFRAIVGINHLPPLPFTINVSTLCWYLKAFGVLYARTCSIACCIQLFATPRPVCSPLCSSVHGILQVARGSSRPRDGTHVSPTTQADSLSLNHQGSLLCLTGYFKPNLF